MTRKETAEKLFLEGYNCSQSVVLAFEDILPLGRSELLKISSSFGGGIGRLREVCGAVSGMSIIIGLLYGYDKPETGKVKTEHYSRIQTLAYSFEKEYGSVVCREILRLDVKHDSPEASPRTPDFYKNRPCKEIIGKAAELIDEYIKNNPV